MLSAVALRTIGWGGSAYGAVCWVDSVCGAKPRSAAAGDDRIVHLPLGLTLAHADDGGSYRAPESHVQSLAVTAVASKALAAVKQKSIEETKAAGTAPAQLGSCGKKVPIEAASLQPYEGRWLVIFRSPGSMEQFFDLFRVSPWIRWVAKHVPGYQLKVDEKQGVAHLSILTPVPFVKLTETYRLDGEETTSRRRDFRPGQLPE